jgi:hypothetical protein
MLTVAVLVWPPVLAEVMRTATVWPDAILALVVQAPPEIEICGLPAPETVAVNGTLNPDTATLLDVITVFVVTLFWLVNEENESGESSIPPPVVVDQFAETPPMLTAAVRGVVAVLAEVMRTAMVCPELIVALVVHAPPATDICGDPAPDTDAVSGTLNPVTVVLAEVIVAFSATPDWLMNENASGTLSWKVTVADPELLPTALVQVSVYVVVEVGVTVWLPDRAQAPPRYVQDVAPLEDQLNVELPPGAIVVGLADTDTAGTTTLIVTEPDAVVGAVGPVQIKV